MFTYLFLYIFDGWFHKWSSFTLLSRLHLLTPPTAYFLCESRALRSWFAFTIFYSCFQCFRDFLKAKPQCPHWCRCMPIRPAGKPTLCDDDDEWSWLKWKKTALPVDGMKRRVSRVVKAASTSLLNFGTYSTSGLENSDNQRVRHGGMNGVALHAVVVWP